MSRIAGLPLTPMDIVRIGAGVIFGVITVVWIAMVLPEVLLSLSQAVTTFLLGVIGASLSLILWGGYTAQTARARLLLTYLVAALLTLIVLVGGYAPSGLIPAGFAFGIAFLVGGVIYFSGVSDDMIFLCTWVCMQGIYLPAIFITVLVLYHEKNLLAPVVGGGLVLLIAGTRQALIKEREMCERN